MRGSPFERLEFWVQGFRVLDLGFRGLGFLSLGFG